MAAQASSVRLRVAAVIPEGDGLLLVRHGRGSRSYHLLPGGGVERGESLASALEREVLEETGVTCEVGAPLFISDSIDPAGARHMVQITFLARALSVDAAHRSLDARVTGTEIVPVSALGSLDLRPPMAEALAEAVASGFSSPARYLGALWVDERGTKGTVHSVATDV